MKILTFDENVIVQFSLQLKQNSAREWESMRLSRQPPSEPPDELQRLSVYLWTFSMYDFFFCFWTSEAMNLKVLKLFYTFNNFQTWSGLCLAWAERSGDGNERGSQT